MPSDRSESAVLHSSTDHVTAICDALDLSEAATTHAERVAERTDSEYAINRTPRVTAASAVYLVALLENEKRTQQEVADAADVSKMAIRQCYREIAHAEGYEFAGDERASSTENGAGLSLLGRLFARLGWGGRSE